VNKRKSLKKEKKEKKKFFAGFDLSVSQTKILALIDT